MVNIFDTTNKIAEELEKLPEFEEVKKAIFELKESPEDLAVYQEMMEFQTLLQTKQAQGQEITEEEDAKFNTFNEKMFKNEKIANLMAKEQLMFQLLQQIQQSMTRPLDQLYSELNK